VGSTASVKKPSADGASKNVAARASIAVSASGSL
jgi:hypothetical protein